MGIKGFTYLGMFLYSAGDITRTVEEYRHDRTGMEFVLIPAGRFRMGDDSEYHTGPEHEVDVPSFLMSKYECTQDQWRRVMGAGVATGEGNLVQGTGWHGAREFCKKAGLRLPTEAEWEYACRAGQKFYRFVHAQFINEYAWLNVREAMPVGLKKPNAFGMYDIYGNVWEWCEDVWHIDYNLAPTDGSAWLTLDLEEYPENNWRGSFWRRVVRGFSYWNSHANSVERIGAFEDQLVYVGFRPAATPHFI